MSVPRKGPRYLKFWKMIQSNLGMGSGDAATVDKIIAGKAVYDRDSFSRIIVRVLSAMEKYVEIVGRKPSNYTRICAIDAYIPKNHFEHIVDSFDKVLQKDQFTSISLAKRGDKFHQTLHYGSALLRYNLAVCFAPPASQNLAEIYSKRASLFITTNNLSMALSDIEAALSFQKLSKKLKSDLLRQKENCLKMERIIKDPSVATLKDPKNQKYTEEVIFKVKGKKNPKMPSAAACIEMRFTKERGRHLVTTKDLKPGVTVIVEEPFVTLMDNCMEWEMKHCLTCCKRIWRAIPCNDCVFAIYCSETCRNKDYENGHKYLCPCSPYIHATGIDTYEHLALKAVCRAGPEYLFEAYEESIQPPPPAENVKDSDLIPGFDPASGIYHSNSHYQLMHLINHVKTEKELNEAAFSAVLLTKVLEGKSKFFSGIPVAKKEKFFNFIALAILQHSCTFPYNGVELTKPTDHDQPKLMYPERHQFKPDANKYDKSNAMTAIFSLCSIMNHACESNISWEQSKDGRLAIVTRQNLKAGEELFFSYGYSYTDSTFQERLDWSLENYRFKCTCIACVLKWPKGECVPERQPFLCSKCNSNYSHLYFNKHCWLKEKDGIGICCNCSRKFKLSTLTKKKMKYEAQLKKAYDLLLRKKPLDAHPLVLNCITYFQNYVRSPSRSLFTCQNLFWQTYNDIIDL